MAQVTIQLGPLSVQIEDEDSGFRPLARKARSLVRDLSAALTAIENGEDEEEGEDG